MAGPALHMPALAAAERHDVVLGPAAHRREVAPGHDPARRDDHDRANRGIGLRLPAARDAIPAAARCELGELRPPAAADRRERPAEVHGPPRRRQRLDGPADAEVPHPPAEVPGAQAERRQIVPGVAVHRRERTADEEHPMRLGKREHAAVDPRCEPAELARAGPHGGQVRPAHGLACVVRELGEVPGDEEPPPNPEQVVDAARLLVARGPVGSRHLPASNRALRDMRPRRCGCWSRVCGDQGEGCDDSCRAAASVEARCRDGDSFQYEKLAGRYRRPCGAARRTPEAYENFKRASHGTGCLTPATRHRTLAPWSQAPTAGSQRRSAGCGGRSEAEWRGPRRTSPWPAGSTGTWPWRTTPRR